MEGDERRFRSVKRSSLGMPMCTSNKYSRRFKRLSLGMPPMHYIFITSCVMCFAWSVLLFTFLGLFCFLCCSNNSDPRLLCCVGEKHASLNQNSLQDLHAYFLLAVSSSCSFFLAAGLFSCSALAFLELLLFRLNFLQVACFILVREFACCTESCVLTRKQVVKVAFLFEVVTCNSFEVLTRVMFELLVSRALAYQ